MQFNSHRSSTLHAITRAITGGAIALAGLGAISVGATAAAQCVGPWVEVHRGGPGAPTDRQGTELVYDSLRGVSVLYGQSTFVWEWDGASWTSFEPQIGPGALIEHSMAFDSARGVVVLFGGNHQPGLNGETWEWDGAEWRLVAMQGPTPRTRAAMCYDAARERIILFGGADDLSYHNDLWEWDGERWSNISTPEGPSPRIWATLTYDPIREVSVLFGGRDLNGVNSNETWEWDGNNWSLRATSGPAPRWYHAAANTIRGGVMIYGGWDDGLQPILDCWEWDGRSWSIVDATEPSDRANHAMTFDSRRGVTILHGGHTNISALGVWEYQDPAPYVTDHPDDLSVRMTDPITLTVEATGDPTLEYQWRRGGQDVFDGSNMSGSNTDTLTIHSAGLTDAGEYDVVVTNGCGEAVSEIALVSVVTNVELYVEATCPSGGAITIGWDGATPNGQIALVYAQNTGGYILGPGSACPGVQLGLGTRNLQLVYVGSAGGAGERQIHSSAVPGVCGGHFQLLDLETCATSNVAQVL